MKVIFKPVGKEPYVMGITDTLGGLQRLVDGYIETVTLFEDACVICDEDGRLKGKPYNCTILGQPFVGDIALVGTKGTEFCDIPVTLEAINKMKLFV